MTTAPDEPAPATEPELEPLPQPGEDPGVPDLEDSPEADGPETFPL